MIISGIASRLKDRLEGANKTKIKATGILMKKNFLDLNDFNASLLDNIHEFFNQGVTFQLVSATSGDPRETQTSCIYTYELTLRKTTLLLKYY